MSNVDYSKLTSIFRQPVILLGENGDIVYWSKEFESFSGISKENAIGNQFTELIQPDVKFNDILANASDSKFTYEFSAQINNSSGVFSYVPLQQESLNFYAVLLNSDFKSKSCYATLNFKKKMVVIERLVSVVVHDLNNAIGGITGTLSLIDFKMSKGAGIDSESIVKYAGIMNESVSKVTDFMTLLSSFSCNSGQAFIKESISALLDRSINNFHNITGLNIGTNAPEYDKDLCVNINPIYMEDGLSAILNNALYAVEKKKALDPTFIPEVTVSSRLVTNNNNENAVAIEIYDNGTGINGEVISKVFDPYYTTKPKGDGKGLGLSIANCNIINSGGFMLIDSKENEWTKVTVYLPVS